MNPIIRVCLTVCQLVAGVTARAASHETTALNGRVSVQFPSKPTRETQTVKINAGEVKFESFKARAPGVFMNQLITSYPAAIIRDTKDPVAFIERNATGNEKQKKGAERVHFKEIKESKHWAAEHRFTQPAGKKKDGGRYAAGFAIHRFHLVDSSMVTVFVDMQNELYEKRAKVIDKRIKDFFDSLTIRSN